MNRNKNSNKGLRSQGGRREASASEEVRLDIQGTEESFLIVDDVVYLLNAMAMEFEQNNIPTVKVCVKNTPPFSFKN